MTDLAKLRRIEALQPNGIWWPVTGLLDQYDGRVAELLAANGDLVTARRVADGRAAHFENSANHLRGLYQNGMRRIAMLEEEASRLRDEVARMKADARDAWKQAHEWMLRCDTLLAEKTQAAMVSGAR